MGVVAALVSSAELIEQALGTSASTAFVARDRKLQMADKAQ